MSKTHPPEVATFPTSGLPTYIQWYRCYEDPSQTTWLDGEEYRQLREDGNERALQKWRFFYRPIRALVGRPQKQMIREAEEAIKGWRRRIEEFKSRLIREGIIFGLAAIVAFAIEGLLVLLPLVIALLRFAVLREEPSKAKKAIEDWQLRITSLEEEVEQLVRKLPTSPPPDAAEIEKFLAEEIERMERQCMAEIVNKSQEDETLFDDIYHAQLVRENPYNLHGLWVEGWGALQPPEVRGPMGTESTGLSRVYGEVGPRLTTWRRGTRSQPIYRIFYLQHIFLLEKNISAYGYFYDFITGKMYGKRSEVFQYNHVANYSLRDVGLEEADRMEQLGLPKDLQSRFTSANGKELNAFTLTASSGTSLRCVLTDDTVIRSINEVFEQKSKKGPLEAGSGGRDGMKAPSEDGAENLLEGWETLGAEDRAELLERLSGKDQRLEEQDIHLGCRAIQQIREAMESYTQNVSLALASEEHSDSWRRPA